MLVITNHGNRTVELLREARELDKAGRKALALLKFNAACAWSRENGSVFYPEIRAAASRYRYEYLMKRG